MRFSPHKARDLLLSRWIAEDTLTGTINISEVLKDLLYAWYTQRHLGDGSLPAPPGLPVPGTMPAPPQLPPGQLNSPPPEEREDPRDPLVRKLLGLSFDQLSAR
jgi:hypothetical protein